MAVMAPKITGRPVRLLVMIITTLWFVCLTATSSSSVVSVMLRGGRGSDSSLSDGIKLNKLFIISWIKNYLIKLPTTEPYIADHQNVKSNFKLGQERGWQFWHYETKANCSTCWIQPMAFFLTSLQAVYNIINGDLYIEGNDIISLQPSKLKGPPRQNGILYYYCPAAPQPTSQLLIF